MKQLIQAMNNGEMCLEEVPMPVAAPGTVVVQTVSSLISQGTEKMLVDFANASLIEKVALQPERVKQVLEKLQSDGLRPTLAAVQGKLNQSIPLGYCNYGIVHEVGEGVRGFQKGDRVVSNGPHAEFVAVKENLCAKVPDGVSDEDAVFTVIGAIALQGIRLVEPTFGETVVVVGLGLVGLAAAQLLKANGCRVIGIDIDPLRVELAASMGVQSLLNEDEAGTVTRVEALTSGYGADAALITASTSSHKLVSQTASMMRQRARIVLIGVVGLHLNRSDFYEKELTFQVSCSYGPGRYDPDYERKGRDYPIGFVRWTENRNFVAVLQALELRQISFASLVSRKIPLQEARSAYADLDESIATIIEYGHEASPAKTVQIAPRSFEHVDRVQFGVIGAGNFARSTLLPALDNLGRKPLTIVSEAGLNAAGLAKKFGIPQASSDYTSLLTDTTIDLVMIATQHHLHAQMVCESLAAEKHVFVEKPLCLTEEELEKVETAFQDSDRMLFVGFNRRHAPISKELRQIVGERAVNIVMTINAGVLPSGSWIEDPSLGGGRVLSELCHFLDLGQFLAGSRIHSVCMNNLRSEDSHNDDVMVLLRFENGSQASINYFTNGHRGYPKERIEVFCDRKTLVVDNWRGLKGFGTKSRNSRGQDKGHNDQFKAMFLSLESGHYPDSYFADVRNVTIANLACVKSVQENGWIEVRP